MKVTVRIFRFDHKYIFAMGDCDSYNGYLFPNVYAGLAKSYEQFAGKKKPKDAFGACGNLYWN